MGLVLVVVALGVYAGGLFAYRNWLRAGLEAQTGVTNLSRRALAETFEAKVGRLGWSIVDDDNPMVAQSPLLAGRRQQIVLTLSQRPEGGIAYRIEPRRVWSKYGIYTLFISMPYKAHTLRMRMTSFVAAINAEGDGSAPPTLPELEPVSAPPFVASFAAPPVQGAELAPTSADSLTQVALAADRFARERTMQTYRRMVSAITAADHANHPAEYQRDVASLEAELHARSSYDAVYEAAQRVAVTARSLA